MAIIAADRELKISLLPNSQSDGIISLEIFKYLFKLKKKIIILNSTPLVINDLHLYPSGY